MHSNRLQLGLEQAAPSDWHLFEKLSSAFLAVEYPELRTTASAAGDRGRDAELFSPIGESTVKIQYSTENKWEKKIKDTIKVIERNFPETTILIYMSSRPIGAKGDAVKKVALDSGLSLDIRDASWFIERCDSSNERSQAAHRFAQAIVDPFLASKGIAQTTVAELTHKEAYAAATYLGLQLRDDESDKGLTRMAFEALVKASLAGTDTNNRIGQAELVSRVCEILPGHSRADLERYVVKAVKSLGKSHVKQHADGFCLSFDESQKMKEHNAATAISENILRKSLETIAEQLLVTMKHAADSSEKLAQCIRETLELVIFEQSQAFAMAVHQGSMDAIRSEDAADIAIRVINRAHLPKKKGVDWRDLVIRGLQEAVVAGDPAIHAYLRSLSDSYTFLAFLKQTPDVQAATAKMFAHGVLWIDTNVILPLLADTLAEQDDDRGHYAAMVGAARDAGMQLRITPGVIEEIERHMNKAILCDRAPYGTWTGSIPFLLSRFIASGRPRSDFALWLRNFRGESRPLQDIEIYLQETFQIVKESLDESSRAAPADLRYGLQAIWLRLRSAAEKRHGTSVDSASIARLIEHDIECYAGVVQVRSREAAGPFGYGAWWLTIDKKAFLTKRELEDVGVSAPPDSPVMSVDFLVNYLTFGPVRRYVRRSAELQLPFLAALSSAVQLSPDLMAEADSVRGKLVGATERTIRREVRDSFDAARRRIGPKAIGGRLDVQEEWD